MQPSTRRSRKLGFMLAGVAGYCDASAFVALLGVFISHMSGTSTRLAVELGQGAWRDAIPYAIVVVGFVAGAIAGDLWLMAHPRALRVLLRAEAAVLLVVAMAGMIAGREGVVTHTGLGRVLLGGVAATAMGSQASAVRKAAGIPVNTTFVTGMLTQAAEQVVAWLRGGKKAREGFVSYGGVWLSFVAGGVLGAAAVTRYGIGVLAVASGALVILSVWAAPVSAESLP